MTHYLVLNPSGHLVAAFNDENDAIEYVNFVYEQREIKLVIEVRELNWN